jgi:uncharacterized protein DUF6259
VSPPPPARALALGGALLALVASASTLVPGMAFAAQAPPEVAGAMGPRLASSFLAIQLAPEESGLGVMALEHRSGEGQPETFVAARPAEALIWRLILRGPGENAEEVRIDNRAPSHRSARVDPEAGTAFLRWEGIDLPGEAKVVDVSVKIQLPRESSAALLEISFENRSARLGPWEVHFPALSGFAEKGKVDLVIPRGNWGVLQKGATAAAAGTYPSNDWPMQFLAALKGDRGFLFTARDPKAWPKKFHVEPGGELRYAVFPEDMGKPGTGARLPFPVSIESFRGSYWTAAKLYRSFALTAPWAARGPIAGRKDFPEALRRTALWWLGSGSREEVVPRMKLAAARFDVPLAVHWYNWHQIPFDVNYPEYFPPKPGFAEGVKELVTASQGAMPYINGRLWDVAGPNFPAAKSAACKKPGGTELYVETYGSGAKLAPMCPATPIWQAKVREIVRRLGEECGVNGVYIDQIGSAAAVLCHDPAHRHPLGGGGHWVEGYREMLRPLRDFAGNRGMFLTTENNAEPYMDTIDAFLIWLPRTDDEVPLITAVYGGRAVYFSSPSREGMDPDAFAMLQGRDLLWGCQLGWMDFGLLEEGRKEQAAYLLECGRYRRTLEPFLLEGELLGELALEAPPPPIEAAWGGWKGTHAAKLPSVVTAIWRAPDGRLAILAANLSREPRASAYTFDGAAWGIPPAARRVKLARIRPQAREDLGEAEAKFRREERLGPREILAIEVKP